MVLNCTLLSPHSSLILKILAATHASSLGGCYGLHESLARIRISFYWQQMQASVKDYIKEYNTCQRCKIENCTPAGLV